jgi:hypothetical protein
MRSSRLIVAVMLALVGVVWVGQGSGLIGGSFMSGSGFWGVVGAILLAAAAVLVGLEVRRAPRA